MMTGAATLCAGPNYGAPVAMEFQDVVRRRRMVRAFQDRPVPEDVIQRILSNATHAPSAGFSQGWAFLVLVDGEARARFWSVAWPEHERGRSLRTAVLGAPVVIVPLAHKQAYLDRYAESDKGAAPDDDSRWTVPYWLVDTAFASMLMLLTAVDASLGALFFGLRDPPAVMGAFGVDPAFTPIGAIAIGYPAPDTPSPSLTRGRRPVDQVVHRDAW